MEHNSNNVRELSLFPDDDTESEERQEVDKIDLQPLFDRLAKSKFRSSFYLNAKDKAYKGERLGKDRTRHKGDDCQATGSGIYPQRRQADTDAPRHFPAVHRPACHRLLLPRLSGEMAWHTERPSTYSEGTDIYHSRHHGVAEKKRPVNVIKRLINVSGEY